MGNSRIIGFCSRTCCSSDGSSKPFSQSDTDGHNTHVLNGEDGPYNEASGSSSDARNKPMSQNDGNDNNTHVSIFIIGASALEGELDLSTQKPSVRFKILKESTSDTGNQSPSQNDGKTSLTKVVEDFIEETSQPFDLDITDERVYKSEVPSKELPPIQNDRDNHETKGKVSSRNPPHIQNERDNHETKDRGSKHRQSLQIESDFSDSEDRIESTYTPVTRNPGRTLSRGALDFVKK